jgi:hypothetical protein
MTCGYTFSAALNEIRPHVIIAMLTPFSTGLVGNATWSVCMVSVYNMVILTPKWPQRKLQPQAYLEISKIYIKFCQEIL